MELSVQKNPSRTFQIHTFKVLTIKTLINEALSYRPVGYDINIIEVIIGK